MYDIDNTSAVLAHEMIHADLDRLDGLLKNYQVSEGSTESFRILTNIVDAFTRVIFNITRTVLGTFKNFKRSELQTYHDSHKVALARLFNATVFDFGDLKIATPNGMKTDYITAVNALESLYGTLDITTTLSGLLDYVRQYDKLTVDQYDTMTYMTKKLTASISKVTKQSVENTLRDIFTQGPDKPQYSTAKDVIASLDDLKMLDEKILKYNQIFTYAAQNASTLAEIESRVDKLIGSVSNLKLISPSYLRELQNLLYVAAEQVDMYGVILHEQQRIEHNFVLALHTISQAYLRQ